MSASPSSFGQAFTLCHDRRDSIGYIQLLEGVFEHFPAKEWVLIADNLSIHISKETQAALLATKKCKCYLSPNIAAG